MTGTPTLAAILAANVRRLSSDRPNYPHLLRRPHDCCRLDMGGSLPAGTDHRNNIGVRASERIATPPMAPMRSTPRADPMIRPRRLPLFMSHTATT